MKYTVIYKYVNYIYIYKSIKCYSNKHVRVYQQNHSFSQQIHQASKTSKEATSPQADGRASIYGG